MPTLNVENVHIKTASVEIKTLTIQGKQLTLSVFRQIPEAYLISHEDYTLNGVPWGVINYFWGEDSKSSYGKLHIVWQEGNELKRSIINNSFFSESKDDREYIRELEKELRFLRDEKEIAKKKALIEFEKKSLHEFEIRFEKMMKPLRELPQLYIAV